MASEYSPGSRSSNRNFGADNACSYSYIGAKVERYSNPSAALTSITIDNQGGSRDGSWVDLAKGCGGDFVYLVEHRDPNNPYKISEIALLRSGDKKTIEDVQSRGYSGMTGDVCDNRGGDYVYIIWKTVRVL